MCRDARAVLDAARVPGGAQETRISTDALDILPPYPEEQIVGNQEAGRLMAHGLTGSFERSGRRVHAGVSRHSSQR